MLYEWWERYRRIAIAAAVILFAGISVWLYGEQQAGTTAELPLREAAAAAEDETSSPDEPSPPVGEKRSSGEPDAVGDERSLRQDAVEHERPPKSGASPLFVDVKGKVKQPGLYRFEAGARVADAIAQAGGAAPDADLEGINLAEPLTDGSAIVVPAKGKPATPCCQPAPLSAIAGSGAGAGSGSVGAGSPGVSLGAGISNGVAGSGKGVGAQTVNLNTAGLEELMTLPGIGESRAKAILAYRTENGAFRSPEELKRISGIGDKLYQRLKDHVRIR
jgi:competence protein ComEA